MQRGSLKAINFRGVKVWRAQWRENGKGRTRILGTYREMTRDQARSALDRILAPLAALAAPPAATSITLRRFVEDEYLSVKSRVWKSSTRATTEQIVSTHILVKFGSRSISGITRKELQAHLDVLAEQKLSFSVIGHVRSQLAAIFRMAQSDGLMTINAAAGLVTPRCHGTVDKRVISVEDIQRAQMVLDPRERLIFRLSAREGLRPGEITGIQIGDIENETVYIERRVYRGGIDTPKSKRSRRPVPLSTGTRALLAEYLDMVADRTSGAWLFTSEHGTPLRYDGVWRRLIQPKLKTVGLGAINFQVLRRTWVTLYAEVETDSKIRSTVAGHSVDVHENEYRQPGVEQLKASMRKLDKRIQ